jgi:hypothetical protein
MSTQAIKTPHADFVSVELNIEAPDVIAIARKMHSMNPEAIMNSYNWDAFIDRYLSMKYPEVREGLQRDPEDGNYVGLYDNNALGNKKAQVLVAILNKLIADPDQIYAYMEEDGDGVEWE